MIINVEEELLKAGFAEESIKKELYWPKGKTVTADDIRAAGAALAAS